jgi:nucleotide-binding universal stress UspA family protein
MRLLLAVDGSQSSNAAVSAVASIHWPHGSVVRVVSVVSHAPRVPLDLAFAGPFPAIDESDPTTRRQVALADAVRELGGAERRVESILLIGRPASAIVEEAAGYGADVVVMGSRGHGPWESMLLGSVSAEVVDHAPCPVLVVRGRDLQPVILATDGSAGARRAEHLLTEWPLPQGATVTVVNAVDAGVWGLMGAPIGMGEPVAPSPQIEGEARAEAERLTAEVARNLGLMGIATTAEVRNGEPAPSIVEAARVHGAGLIVVGSRGHSGLTAVLLGSVARNVLLHAPCSVLVVRPSRVRSNEREGQAVRQRSGVALTALA